MCVHSSLNHPRAGDPDSHPADYNHYSQLATVEDNWDLGNLGQGDVAANVYTFLAQGLDHDNTDPQPLEPGIGPYLEPNNGVEPGPVT
jgi:hypothetical protein